MNSYQRLIARLHGEPVDQVPNLCILMGFAARHTGIPYREFCLQPERMVQANLSCHETFGVDIVTVMSDPYGEAMDYGLAVSFPEDGAPRVERPFWLEEPSAASLPLRRTEDTVRMKNRVRTIQLYADQVKGTCPIAGWIEGPVAEYCDLRGISEAMIDFADDEPYLDEVLGRLEEQAGLYAKAQIDAGADIIGIGDAACSLLGPSIYMRYAFQRQKRLVDAIHAMGGLVKLHICGNIGPLLPDIAKLKADIVDIDWMVDFGQAADILTDSSVCGEFGPVVVLRRGTEQEVERAVGECLRMGSSRTLISGGCETPPDTPYANLMAVHRALYAARS